MYSTDSCILELRARVEALEAQGRNYPDSSTPPPVATDEELMDTVSKAGTSWIQGLRASYNLGVTHGQAGSREVAEPAPGAGGLVERVADMISNGDDGHHWHDQARAAILEVARWLRSHDINGSAKVLEQEAGR
jgi:hypothetical protein